MTIKTHIERILGISLPDYATFRLKKDGTIEVHAQDKLETRYRVKISPQGEVTRSRVCSAVDLAITLPAKYASREMRMRYPGRKQVPFCYDYTMREPSIISCARLRDARLFISTFIFLTTGRFDALIREISRPHRCAMGNLIS